MDVSWTAKKAEHQRIDAFELWCWRRLLRVPWSAKRANQSILNEILNEILNIHWKDWCWIWNSKTLATWWEELTHWKRPWCWERLKAGGEGDDKGWDGWMASLAQWTWVWASFGSWWWTGKPDMLQSMRAQSCTQLSDWTDSHYGIFWIFIFCYILLHALSVNCFTFNFVYILLFQTDNCYFGIVRHIDFPIHRAKTVNLSRKCSLETSEYNCIQCSLQMEEKPPVCWDDN